MVQIPQNTRKVSMKEIVEIVTRLGAEGGGAINVTGKWKGKPRTVCIEQLVWCKTSVCLVGGYGNEVSSLSPRDVPFVLNCVLGNYLDDDTNLSVMPI